MQSAQSRQSSYRRFSRRRLAKIDHHRRAAKAARLNTYIQYPQREPNSTDCFSQVVQVPPNQTAKEEPDERQNRIAQETPFVAFFKENRELPECGQVHSHECEECAKIQQLAGMLVGAADVIQQYGACECKKSNKDDVECRRVAPRLQISESSLW